MKSITDIKISELTRHSETYYKLFLKYGEKVLIAVLIFVIGRVISRLVSKIIQRALEKARVEQTLAIFLAKISYILMLILVVISALGALGINTASFAAAIAAAGLAIGLALQGSLSNFASGVLIIIFKPFVKNDYVELAGVAGHIKEVEIFTTTLTTPDNKVIIIPNNSITTSNIINYSREKTRRIDMQFGIDYKDNIKLAKQTLQNILDNEPRVLKDPAAIIAVGALADHSINIVVRPWVKTEQYWDVLFDINEKVKEEFDRVGLSIPYPQTDVHIVEIAENYKKDN